MTGTLYGVSLGPGDPGLITRAAWQRLQDRTALWTYPVVGRKRASYALDIARRAGLPLPPDHTPLHFPMTHDAAKLACHWLAAAQTVLAALQTRRDVLFLVEGDASTYATFGHLARTVRELDGSVAIEVIPGVPAYNAAAARLGRPLAETDDSIAILPAGYGIEVIREHLDRFDTLVLLKVKPLLDAILDLLAERGLLAHAAFVEKAGAPEERVVTDLTRLRGQQVNYLSLLLVRNPHRQRGPLLRGCRRKSPEEPRTP